MSMLNYNEIKERKYIVLDGDPYEVLDAHVFRKQQRKPVNQTKLRNLINGSVRQETFHAQDTVAEADLNRTKYVFSFVKANRQTGNDEYWFYERDKRSNRALLTKDLLGDATKYLKENCEVDALVYNDNVIGITLPIKMTFKVVEAPPAVKGNTAQGGDKLVKIETGAMITTPLFVNEGDMIVVNTIENEYVERTQGNSY
jgi:elongation factor P